MVTDTWQDLERRFHEIGSRPGKIELRFLECVSKRTEWNLFGPVADGRDPFRSVLIGAPEVGPVPKRDFLIGDYSGSEIQYLLRRAGRLLVDDDPQHIWAGADLFVAMTIRKHRSEICNYGDDTFFPNAGRILGMMAGQMILTTATTRDDDLRKRGQQILKSNPDIKQRQFCRELGIENKTGGDIYRTLTGKEKQRRNTN